jgi:anti-sigma regulatory factor (Ser/Thr protein kinase)
MSATRKFHCRPQSVTAARLFVRDRLAGHPPETVEAAELMATELASNCVLHARTDFELTIDSRNQIRIAVSDTGHGRPRLLHPTPRELSGRGLRIVEAMSDAWGVIPTANGKTVWFTLPQSRALAQEFAPASRSR